jgi:hypothetical protein
VNEGVNEWVTDLLANGVLGGLVSYRTSFFAPSHVNSPIVIRIEEAMNPATREYLNRLPINNLITSVIHLRYPKDRRGS